MQSRRMRLVYRARKLRRGLFGYRMTDVLEALETLEAQAHADTEWAAKDAADLERDVARVRERIRGTEADIVRLRQEAGFLESQVVHRRENLEILASGVRIEAKRLEDEHAQRVQDIQQLFDPVEADIAEADRALRILLESLTQALTTGQPLQEAEPQHFQDVTALLFGAMDPPESIVGSWLDDGRVRLSAVPRQVAVTTRSGQRLGHLSALVVEGFPPRVVGYEIQEGGQDLGMVRAQDIVAVHRERIVVQDSAPIVETAGALATVPTTTGPLADALVLRDTPPPNPGERPGEPGQPRLEDEPPPEVISLTGEHPDPVLVEPSEPVGEAERLGSDAPQTELTDVAEVNELKDVQEVKEVEKEVEKDEGMALRPVELDRPRRAPTGFHGRNPMPSRFELAGTAPTGEEPSAESASRAGTPRGAGVPKEAMGLAHREAMDTPPADNALDVAEDKSSEFLEDLLERESDALPSERLILPGLDPPLASPSSFRAPAAPAEAVSDLSDLSDLTMAASLPGLAKGVSLGEHWMPPGSESERVSSPEEMLESTPFRTAGAGSERVSDPQPMPPNADPRPVEPRLDDKGNVAQDVLVFLVGKVVGQDIVDAEGRLLAPAGTPIDAGLARRVEAAGRLSELIVHMALPKP